MANPDKLLKKALREERKRIRPGECQKYIRIVLDSSVDTNVVDGLKGIPLKVDVRDLSKRNCIIWERNVSQKIITLSELSDQWEVENFVFMLVTEKELRDAIKDKTLDNIGKDLRAVFPDKRYTLVLLRDPSKKPKNDSIGAVLVELQILQELTILEIPPKTTEVVDLLKRYTKSIAEVPFKDEKAQLTAGFKKFFLNDKKDCVRIVGDSGYDRLWRQQLIRLPQLALAHAETIAEAYSCPKKLVDEFDNNPAAISKIADLKVKRNGNAPEQNERRLGPMMATKLYKLYTSRDPNELI